MKQNMKRVFLVLCMAVCFLALSACAKKDDASSKAIPETIENTMKSGAENYLAQFDSYDEAAIDSEIRRQEKQGNAVMATALTSWKSSKKDLGEMVSILSEEVVRINEDNYKITVRASYEKRELVFTLTAEEVVENNYGGGIALMPTEFVFAPVYTTGEKLIKAGMNTLMGMGTVFIVLIFISFVIGSLSGVNTWEENKRKQKEEKAAEAASTLKAAVPAPAVPAPKPVVAAPEPKQVAMEAKPAAPAPIPVIPVEKKVPAEEMLPEEPNLAADLELVAVITAAISAAQNVPIEGLVVRSIRRRTSSNWKKA